MQSSDYLQCDSWINGRVDADFNAKQRVFYYVRALEIPTPRWTTYDTAFYGIDLPKGVPVDQQERAYTSPIWYTP